MSEPAAEEAILSREELDALIAELPSAESEAPDSGDAPRIIVNESDLYDANEAFGYAQGLRFSNRHERVIQISLIGQREIQLDEMSELMLPTDLLAAFNIRPVQAVGYLLLSRPFFFQLLSMSFGSGPTIKPARPPTREYSRIERRFYVRAAKEMLEEFEAQWREIHAVSLDWRGLVGRNGIVDAKTEQAVLATFEVKGFGEACRVRVAIPAAAFPVQLDEEALLAAEREANSSVSVLEVPLRLRAQVGTAELSLSEVSGLTPGQSIALEAPTDGSLMVRIGGRDKFRGVAGVRGSRRAIQLTQRVSETE